MTPLAIYLRNHEAAAQAGLALFRRAASSQRHRPYAAVLGELTGEVASDLDALHHLMRRLDIRPDPALGTLLRIGEGVARFKPNGRVLRRAPLSDLIEIEGMLDAVHAKAAGWRALAERHSEPNDAADLDALIERAVAQVERLSKIHATVAAEILHR